MFKSNYGALAMRWVSWRKITFMLGRLPLNCVMPTLFWSLVTKKWQEPFSRFPMSPITWWSYWIKLKPVNARYGYWVWAIRHWLKLLASQTHTSLSCLSVTLEIDQCQAKRETIFAVPRLGEDFSWKAFRTIGWPNPAFLALYYCQTRRRRRMRSGIGKSRKVRLSF